MLLEPSVLDLEFCDPGLRYADNGQAGGQLAVLAGPPSVEQVGHHVPSKT